jgi:pimeloyl-ACP methyl ester carboxylesterase
MNDPAWKSETGKVRPEFAEGDLVRVAGAQNQPEAELLQGLLLDAGVPSVIRRARGFDVPDFLAAGPRDVLVPASAIEAAREALPRADEGLLQASSRISSTPLRLLAGLLIAVLVAAIIAWFVTEFAM